MTPASRNRERPVPARQPAWKAWTVAAAAAAGLLAPSAASAATYYVSPQGNDAASGTSPATAWTSLGKVAAAALAPGDQVLLRRGGTWSGSLKLSRSGTAAAPIRIGSFGTGALPAIAGGGCVTLAGAWQVLSELEIRNCTRWGVYVTGSQVTVDGNLIHDNVAGVSVDSASNHNVISHNRLINNNRLDASPGSGAFGVLLNGSDNIVAGNLIQGSDTPSPVYGRDGSAVEVYKGQRNLVTRNLAVDNLTFTELGNSASADNTFSYNIVRGSLPTQSFIVTRGSGASYGPVRNTRAFNNTVYFTGAQSEGFVCSSCGRDILVLRNNIISARKKVGYAQGSLDEDFDMFLGGGIRQFSAGPHSFVGDPRWTSAAAGDFRLLPGSQAIDRGQAMGRQLDFAGASAPHGPAPDLGALEWVAATPAASLGARLSVPRAIRRSAIVARGLSVKCRARAAGRCSVQLRLSRRDATRLRLDVRAGAGSVVVGVRTVAIRRGRTATMRLRLGAPVARALLSAPRAALVVIRVTAVVRARDGRTSGVRRTVRLLPG